MGAAAASCYIPVPGLAVAIALAAPADRLVRFHAWQGGLTTLAAVVLLTCAGYLLAALPRAATAAVGIPAALVLVGAVGLLAWGAAGAAMGRYRRLPLVAPVLGSVMRA